MPAYLSHRKWIKAEALRPHLVQPLLRTLSSAFKTHFVGLNTFFWITLGTAKILCRTLRLPDLWWLIRAPRRCGAPRFPVPPRRLEAATDVCIYEVMSVASGTDESSPPTENICLFLQINSKCSLCGCPSQSLKVAGLQHLGSFPKCFFFNCE